VDIDKKLDGILSKVNKKISEYEKIGGMSVEVGLPSDRIHNPSGLTLAELGAIHEFGTEKIPERSFLRSVTILKKTEIKKTMEGLAKKSIEGDSAETLMEQFAIFGQGLVQENIVELNSPPLKSPRKDGSSNPLVDTGAMRQGVIGVVVVD